MINSGFYLGYPFNYEILYNRAKYLLVRKENFNYAVIQTYKTFITEICLTEQ